MYGFNLLGVNSHSSNHDSTEDILSKNYYTKEEIDLLMSGYTPGEGGASLSAYLKITDADNKYQVKGSYLTAHQDISGKLDISTYNSDKESFALKTLIPTNFITEHQSLENYATKEDLSGKADSNHTHSQYLTEHQILKTINGQTITGEGDIEILGGTGTYNDSELRELINGKADSSHTHSEYAEVNHQHSEYLTEHQSLDNYVTKTNSFTLQAEDENGNILEYTIFGELNS